MCYYEVEWLDKTNTFHCDYFFPIGVNVIQTSFYHSCESPRESAIAFVNGLLDGDINTVKFEYGKYKE